MMIENRQFVFAGHAYTFEKGQTQWQLRLNRSDIASQDLRLLAILNSDQAIFLPETITSDDDFVVFTYQVEPLGLPFERFQAGTLSEKARLALNFLELDAILDLPVSTCLHPDNMFITKNGTVKLAYRALPHLMPAGELTPDDFLRQVKCLIIALYQGKDFSELYDGALEVVALPDSLDEIRQATDIASIKQQLEDEFQAQLVHDKNTQKVVNKRQFNAYKWTSILASIFGVCVFAFLVWVAFFQMPFKDKMLKADELYLGKEYSDLIATLDGIDEKDLPDVQRYELAVSYIEVGSFAKDEKDVILSQVTLKGDASYQFYWIAIGRNKGEEALEIAKSLDDYRLVLYAIIVEEERLKQDKNISNADRNAQHQKLEEEKKKYQGIRDELKSEDQGLKKASR